MPVPDIGNRKSLYRRYLQYSDYNRARHSKHLKRWLNAKSAELTGTGNSFEFGVDLTTSGSEVFTASSHGLSAGDGPFIMRTSNVSVEATIDLTVSSQPSVGDTITVRTGIDQTVFSFIASGSSPNARQIPLGSNATNTAISMQQRLALHPGVRTRRSSNVVTLIGEPAGVVGNSYQVFVSDPTSISGAGNFSGGSAPFPAAPLVDSELYYIQSIPDGNTFLLATSATATSGIRPSAAGSGNDTLGSGTGPRAIYDLLRTHTALVIAAEDDIDDLEGF